MRFHHEAGRHLLKLVYLWRLMSLTEVVNGELSPTLSKNVGFHLGKF